MFDIKVKVGGIFSDKKKAAVFIVGGLVLGGAIISGLMGSKSEKDAKQAAIDAANERLEEQNQVEVEEETTEEPAYLLTIQDSLKEAYGPLPDGYLWDTDGTLLSLGDPSLTPEEVVYAFINGLRSLDISMAQKYSRRSKVVNRYEDYFNSSNSNTDYYDSFIRNMYKEVLLSLQAGEVVDTSVFAETKQVFTMKLNVLDLSSKDFWEKDREELYKTLYIYGSDEEDSAKSQTYLYDYVLDYYRSDEAVTRDALVNVTVEKYPDLNTGWLVSLDTDIDDLCFYKDGNLVVSYIQSQYNDEGRDYVRELREKEKEKAEETEDSEEGGEE